MELTGPQRVDSVTDLQFLAPAVTLAPSESVDIDLRGVSWISPLGVVAVLATCLNASSRQARARVLLPRDPDVLSYLSQVGFYRELERGGWPAGILRLDDAVPQPAFLPVSSLRLESDVDAVGRELELLWQRTGVAPPVAASVFDVAVELSSNAREHGSPCYALVQVYSGATSGIHGIHVAVADFGGGFAESLRQRYGDMNDCEAILKGFEEGVSGTGARYRGQGLGYIRDAVDSHSGASLTIVSRRGLVTRQGGKFTETEVEEMGGTMAGAFFPYSANRTASPP